MTIEERLAALEAEMRGLRDRREIFDCIKRTSRGNDHFDLALITGSCHADGQHELGSRLISGQAYGEHANHAHAAIARSPPMAGRAGSPSRAFPCHLLIAGCVI